jgi:hypothetical protein
MLFLAAGFWARHEGWRKPTRHIDRAAYERINDGMTLQNLYDLLGPPNWINGEGLTNSSWATAEVWIKVGSKNDRVVAKHIEEAGSEPGNSNDPWLSIAQVLGPGARDGLWMAGMVLVFALLAVALVSLLITLLRKVVPLARQASEIRLTRRQRWALLGGCFVVATLSVIGWRVSASGGAMRQKYERIRLGMPLDDVVGLMGCPPGDMTKTKVYAGRLPNHYEWDSLAIASRSGEWGDSTVWADETSGVDVCFFDGAVDGKSLMRPPPAWKACIKRLRGLVGW